MAKNDSIGINQKKKIKLGKEDKIFYTICYSIVIVLTLIVLYPIIYIVSASFSDAAAVTQGKVWLWPVEFSTGAYQLLLKDDGLWIGYRNTIFYTILGTLINVSMELMCAYAMSRKELYGKKFFNLFFIFTMFFGGGMIPNYLLVKRLGMLDTIWALVLPGAMSVYNMIVARTFIKSSIPEELLEASLIDGCGDGKYFFKIILPLSKPIIAVLCLWSAVAHWNAYFDAFLYITDEKLYPLQIFVRELLVQSDMGDALIQDGLSGEGLQNFKNLMKYAVIVVTTVPLFAFYPFVQKHFVKGVMVGSVKG